MSPDQEKEILEFIENGTKNYISFRKELFQTKDTMLSDKIKRIHTLSFVLNEKKTRNENTVEAAKLTTKFLGKAQKNIDIARSRGFTNKELLQYDHLDSPLFDNKGLARHKKHEIMTQLESVLKEEDYCYNKQSNLRTVVVVDFMSLVRKVPFKNFRNFNDAFLAMWNMIVTATDARRDEIIYDRYFENSIKKSKRLHRSDVQPVEVINLTLDTTLPVEMESFWASSANKV